MKLTRTAPAKLYRYIMKRHRRPTLPGGITSAYDPRKLSDDAKIMMMMGYARDERGAMELLEGHGTAWDVIQAQPQPGCNVGARLLAWWRRALGVSEHDPLGQMQTEARPVPRLRVRYRSEDETDRERGRKAGGGSASVG